MKTKIYNALNIFSFKNAVFITVLLQILLSFLNSYAQRSPWTVPAIANNLKNPLAGDKSGLADAKTLYINNCAPCHGDKGKGDGPAAIALDPKPADHSSAVVQSETDGSLFWKISEGRNSMPSYKKTLTDKQRWELVNYIRTLSKGQGKTGLPK
jgi:mono/diheme cytochrome c family protein